MKQHPDINQLIDYIHRELAPEEDAAILLHIESCDECRTRYESETRLSEALRLYGLKTERDLPAGVVDRIWDGVYAAQQPAWTERLRALLRPAIAVPVGVAAALAIYFGVTS